MAADAAGRNDGLADDYVNPLEQTPRWLLAAQALAIRSGATIGFGISSLYDPAGAAPAGTFWLDAALGSWKAKEAIRVDVWEPQRLPSRASSRISSRVSSQVSSRVSSRVSTPAAAANTAADYLGAGHGGTDGGRRPAIINFHGGGFVLGQGTDDARWAAAAASALGAVVLSVNYRLAPGYPFPTPVEDCAVAVAQICSEDGPAVKKYRIDPSRVILSGFSAGGALALASWVVLQDPARWGYEDVLPRVPPAVSGLALFYPLLDYTIGRPNKRQACARPDLALPKFLTDLFDASYLYPSRPPEERADLRLSPGLMPDGMLARLPPVHLCLCEHDMLLAEGHAFADRVRQRADGAGCVEVRVVRGEKHGWDKPPPFALKESVVEEYEAALGSIKTWIKLEAETG